MVAKRQVRKLVDDRPPSVRTREPHPTPHAGVILRYQMPRGYTCHSAVPGTDWRKACVQKSVSALMNTKHHAGKA